MAAAGRTQLATLAVGVVIGLVLFAVTRVLIWIVIWALVGIGIATLLRRR